MTRAVHVLHAGLLTTVQDMGRPGGPSRGVAPGGAADPWAARWANYLVGNDPGAAVLEATLAGPRLWLPNGAVVGVAGAEMQVKVDGRPVPSGTAVRARRGAVLESGTARAGARAYIAVDGGFATPEWLGSRSVDLAAGLGAALAAGDIVPLGPQGAGEVWGPAAGTCRLGAAVRVTAGPDAGEALAVSTASRSYRVSARSDRVGVRLDPVDPPAGEKEAWPPGWSRHLSVPMVTGAVQVTPDGTCLVLLAGRGILGGYPVPLVVVRADVPLVAQWAPGMAVRLEMVSRGQALAAWREAERAAPPAHRASQ